MDTQTPMRLLAETSGSFCIERAMFGGIGSEFASSCPRCGCVESKNAVSLLGVFHLKDKIWHSSYFYFRPEATRTPWW
ncbi:MAG: hypothetical protein J4N34_00225, partial [Chloroflexi bacterium]|nr:hypothetical protein [Chloroflexota bacterium]